MVTSPQIAPLWPIPTPSGPNGSVMISASASIRPCSTSQPMPALRTPTVSSSGTALCTIVPLKPTRRSASAAITCAASPLFMSAAPRP